MSVVPFPADTTFDFKTDIVIVGAGACGLTSGLKAQELGADVVVLERDATPSGSTAMSSGFVPAPATRFQKDLGIADNPERFARDIQKKAANGADPALVERVTSEIGPALEWLADVHGLEWIVLDDFLYPGHSAHRMHAVPERTGAALMGRLLNAAEAAGLPLLTNARVSKIYSDAPRTISGVEVTRPDGTTETIGCKDVIFACNGYGGNKDIVAEQIPEMKDALYYGHPGNTGDAMLWGSALGGALKDMSAYQGHGSLAHPHNILITWALMMEGGIQVNLSGQRFSNEHAGYSEQALHVLSQPDRIAWNIFDERLHNLGLGFPDYRDALAAGAILSADNWEDLARQCQLPGAGLKAALAEISAARAGNTIDPYGRDFSNWQDFEPPYHAVKVTGAVFHTQGGLHIAPSTRVLDEAGKPLENLFAAGGAARGVSGSRVEGYLSGNGLLTAIALGFVAGRSAASG